MRSDLFGPLTDESGRRLAKLAAGLRATQIEMLSAQPKAPTSLPKIKYPIDIKGLEDWKEQYIKRDQALELTSTNVPLESNPFREACLNSSISEAKKWSAMYSVNSRGINVNEETLLMECISQSRPFQAIKMLVDLGAFLHVVDRRGRTALHHACETENLAVIELLMRKKAPWFTRDSSGRTPIHIAAGSSSPNCLEMILKYTKNTDEINQGDDELMSPLHWAAAKNNIAHFDIILKKKYGFDLGRTDIEGKTALHWTAPHPVELGKGSSNSCAFKIVKARPAIINNRDMEGRTILHLACGENNLGLVHLIASHPQCDLNAQDDMKRTALHWASVAGYSNIVSVLLKFGADDSVSDEVGATPLHYAASKNHLQSVITLIEGRSYAYLMDLEGRTPIVWAIMKGHLQALRTLLDKGVDIDSRDYTGCTALHAAAASGNTMCASLLIQKGCQIDSLDSNLRSPLFKAIEKGFAEPAALLLQRGAKSALVDQDGRTPLHFGAMYGHLNVLSLLLANECDPNTKDKTGKAPLHCAAYNGHCDVISFLIKSQADPNSRDLDGITSLHWAAGSNHPAAVELLLKLGADPNMIDFVSENEFCTPLDYANATGSLLCAEILLLFGAMTAEALLSKVSTEIGRIWRGYKARKLTNFTPKSRALVEKDERSLPMFYISNSTSDMKPLSRSSTNGHEEQSTRHPNPSLQTLGVPGDLTAALMANRQRRGSSVSMTHFVGRTSTLTGQYYRHEQPIHSIPALPAPDVKDEAATKIQRAWRFRQRRIEAKFLVFMMGPEEASKILEKNFARQQSMISANGSRSSSIGTPQGSGGSASGSSVLLSRDCVLPPTRNHQVRRGSVQTNIGRSNLRLNVQSRPYQLASSRRGSVTTDSTMGGIFNVHGVGSGPSGMQHGFFAQGLASPPTEIEFMSLKTQPHHASSGAKPYQSPKQEENLEFRSNQESSAMTKRRISRKKTYEGSIETLERESSTYLAKKLTKKKTISSSTKTTVSSTRMGESLTADEIDYFRDVAQEYRSGGLKELLNRSKTTSLKPKVVQAAIREEREQPIEPSKSVISQTDARLGNTFSEDELSYFAMMAEEKQREG